MGQASPNTIQSGGKLIQKSPEEKDSGVFVDKKLDMTRQQGAPAGQKAKQYCGLCQKTCGQQVKGGDFLPLYSILLMPQLECCVELWGPQLKKNMDLLE